VFTRYYPDRLPPEDKSSGGNVPENQKTERERLQEVIGPTPFDFRYEMYKTRLTVDRLLEEGEVAEAEAYMEERRQVFWNHGYRIRKLNQAYFAFHGSYAAQPGGAGGAEENRLGQNLRELKDTLPSFSDFMKKVAWMWRLDQFQRVFETELNN
jgi:hypothetical protein